MQSSITPTKLKLISWLVYLVFLLNVGFLIRWQVFEHDHFVAIARERIVDHNVPSIRGEILAADGSSLAYSEPRFNIVVYKTELEFAEEYNKQTRKEFVEKVSTVLNIENSEFEELFEGDQDWIKVKERVSNAKKEEVLNLKRDNAPEESLQGLRIEYTSKRIYPEGTLACHAIGFVGKNDIGEDLGRAGLEYYWEGLLKEQEGFDYTEVDSFGNLIAIDNVETIEAKRGATVYTTIDKNIQMILESHLENAVKKYDAKSASAIVMDPRTGALMGLANYPEFDPNTYDEVEDNLSFKNAAISDPAELGSVGKAFTMAAALEEGKIEPNTVVSNGHSGCVTIKEKERDWEICTYDKKPQGSMTAVQALVNSDNLALYEVSKLIGNEKFDEYLRAFGIGKRTDIDIAGESNGVLKDISEWTNVDSATYAFGHSYQMTPLQAITGIGAIANDGELMRPYLVSKVVEEDDKEKVFAPTVVNQPIGLNTSEKLKAMMYEVFKVNLVENRYKNLSQYRIAMKSGTALIPYRDRAGYSDEVNATYVGFDASDEATFIMLVKIEEPKAVKRLSYYSARILWLDIFVEMKDYLGVPNVGG